MSWAAVASDTGLSRRKYSPGEFELSSDSAEWEHERSRSSCTSCSRHLWTPLSFAHVKMSRVDLESCTFDFSQTLPPLMEDKSGAGGHVLGRFQVYFKACVIFPSPHHKPHTTQGQRTTSLPQQHNKTKWLMPSDPLSAQKDFNTFQTVSFRWIGVSLIQEFATSSQYCPPSEYKKYTTLVFPVNFPLSISLNKGIIAVKLIRPVQHEGLFSI